MFTDLDPGAGVGAAPWAGRDGYDAAPQGDDVVLADSAPVAEAEDVSRVLASRKAAVGGTWLCWRLAKACVVPCQESGQRGVGLLKSGDVGQPQLLVEAVLEGAPEALDTALGLGRASADPGDAELIEDAPDLGRQRLAGELFLECERFLRPGLKDHVAVAVKRERYAALAHHFAQEQEVTLGVLLFAKESVGNVACGVIDRSDESKPGPVWTQPLVAAAGSTLSLPALPKAH